MSWSSRVRILSAGCVLLLASTVTVHTAAEAPANAYFQRVWQRTDKPVADSVVSRTWQWGPQANTGPLREPYAESPSGEREVQYYDKSRMEITQPGADTSSIWYVTNGLLVVELMTGRLQLGDNTFEQRPAATVNVAGDGDDKGGPTYASLAGGRNAAPLADGSTIIQAVDRAGTVGTDSQYAGFGVTAAHRVTAPNIDHQVASPFWSFMNASGPVYQNGGVSNALLFENPFFATGLPITEAYWAQIKVGGVVKPVLLQCFERRCLTYTPDNPAGWQVEQGNVGQHYYQWRYGANDPGGSTATEYRYASAFGRFSYPDRQMQSPFGVAFDSQGNLYVADNQANRVQKYDPNGIFVRQWGGTGSAPGLMSNPGGIAVDANDNVWVADTQNNRIQIFDSDGVYITARYDGMDGPTGIAVNAANEVFVTDTRNDRIMKFRSDGILLGTWGSSGSDIGRLSSPTGIAVDGRGLVYVCDSANRRIHVFESDGTSERAWASSSDFEGFGTPAGIAVSADNERVYVSDHVGNSIHVFDPTGVYLMGWGARGNEPGQLMLPVGLAVSETGELLVADMQNSRVQAFDSLSGEALSLLAGDTREKFVYPVGVEYLGQDRVAVVDATLNQVKIFTTAGDYVDEWGSTQLLVPRDVAFDTAGFLYVSDTDHNRIVKYTLQGVLLDDWGSAGSGNGQFQAPAGVEVDADGNVYVADQRNNRIQKFTREGVFITAWGASGDAPGKLNEPFGIEVRGNSVYVTEGGNHRVQEFDLNGGFIRQWGSFGSGPGQLNVPYGITSDGQGYLYVVDAGNDRVQKFAPDGTFVTQFGMSGSGEGQLLNPLGIAVTPDGKVFVADPVNNRIAIFSPVQ